jgi:hypothetical protein
MGYKGFAHVTSTDQRRIKTTIAETCFWVLTINKSARANCKVTANMHLPIQAVAQKVKQFRLGSESKALINL